jgi:hypothetical protein
MRSHDRWNRPAINLILELAARLQFVHLVGERERLVDSFLRRLSYDDRAQHAQMQGQVVLQARRML